MTGKADVKLRHSAKASALTALAVVTGVLAAITAVTPDWIEVAFGVHPDGGDGSLERIVVLSLALVTIVLALGARHAWKRSRLSAR